MSYGSGKIRFYAIFYSDELVFTTLRKNSTELGLERRFNRRDGLYCVRDVSWYFLILRLVLGTRPFSGKLNVQL